MGKSIGPYISHTLLYHERTKIIDVDCHFIKEKVTLVPSNEKSPTTAAGSCPSSSVFFFFFTSFSSLSFSLFPFQASSFIPFYKRKQEKSSKRKERKKVKKEKIRLGRVPCESTLAKLTRTRQRTSHSPSPGFHIMASIDD